MKKYFLTGLATLLPVAVTVWVVLFVVDFLTRPFIGLTTKLLSRIPNYGLLTSPPVIKAASQILILIALFLLIIALGIVGRTWIIKLLQLGEQILLRTPVVKGVYKPIKEIINILLASNMNSFNQVVMVHFPYKESYCIGLITREAPKTCSEKTGKEMLTVFVPTTPNPMTGFLIASPKEELIYLDMKVGEAFNYIVSCAVIQPGSKP